MTPPNFAWQAWHLATSTFVSRGRRGTYGTGLALVARLGALGRPWSPVTPPNLRDRRGTWRHMLSFWVAGVALGDSHATLVSRGKRGTFGTGLALLARLGALGRQ